MLVNDTFNASAAVFKYHQICRTKRDSTTASLTCFRDNNYLCVCEKDYYRAECFGYDRNVDRCSLCLANGYCLKGNLQKKQDFLCLCPHCYHGKLCQFSNELMSFTLDSLIAKDIQTNRKLFSGVYISTIVIIFLFGLFNNLCSYVTFRRPKPRKFGLGNYLLIISITNQFSLTLLLLKVIHITLGSNGTLFYHSSFNLYSCKIVSYLLSVCTRITYWLTSLVTIERLWIVLFPTSNILKKPPVAFGLIFFFILGVFGMHVHEVLYYITIIDPSYVNINITLCVTNYVQPFISIYNRVNVLIHYFAPFLIQFFSITILIVQTARNRARVGGNSQQTFVDLFKKQFRTHKDHYVTPIIIVLSSLPQAIFSFAYACTESNQLWQRYMLLSTYFLSYLPQFLGFILYVIPSTTFKEEFQQTVIGKILTKKSSAA